MNIHSDVSNLCNVCFDCFVFAQESAFAQREFSLSDRPENEWYDITKPCEHESMPTK